MKKLSVLTVLVMLVTISAYSVSGTYAKYTSSFEATDSARVAKWAFVVDKKEGETQDFTFDLFSTVKDEDGTEENDVKKGTDENIIAPGTSGSFDIALTNNSEVTAKADIYFEKTADSANVPLDYRITYTAADGTETTTEWSSDVTKLNIVDAMSNINMNGNATVKVEWKWAFERGTVTDPKVATTESEADTALGSAADAQNIAIKATVVASQVN